MFRKCRIFATCVILSWTLLTVSPLPIQQEAPDGDHELDYHFETNFVTPDVDINELASLKWSIDYASSMLHYMLIIPLYDDGTVIEGDFEPLSLGDREWVAIGMSPYGAATEADMVTFIRGAHDEITVLDTYTDEYGVLGVDDQQDYKLRNAWINHHSSQDDGERNELVIEYGRKIDTCDEKDYLVERGTTHLLFLRGPGSWPLNGSMESSIAPHHSSLRRVTLLKPDTPQASFPADTKTIQVTVDNVAVPDADTTYWCKVSQFPDTEEKHHIVKYEVVVSEGNEDLVHHIEVYHCDVASDVDLPAYQGPCDERPADSPTMACSQVIGAWAMGAEAFVYPDEAGIAIGGPDTSSFIMIEIHYNNPTLKAGINDSSGLRFYYTPTLRPYDAGILELGLVYTPRLSIPPGEGRFQLTGHCLPKCTRQGLPSAGIHAFASQLHTHLTGTAVWTRHVRGGVERPELNRDNHFTSDFQEIRMLPDPVHILPGDYLITSCRYDTRNKDNVTMGGFGISDEMCVNYVHYYPRSPLEVCKSTISERVLRNFFAWTHGEDDGALDDLPDEAVVERFNDVTWDDQTTRVWQDVVSMSNVDMDCLTPSAESFRGYWEDMPRGRIRKPLRPATDRCTDVPD